MHPTQVVIDARVSSEQPAQTPTIARQVAAVRARVAPEGLAVSAAMPCLDAGYRGATLVRPALERRREVVAAGSVERLSVPSPDRLARTEA
jgi:site-specific DNA recombinase